MKSSTSLVFALVALAGCGSKAPGPAQTATAVAPEAPPPPPLAPYVFDWSPPCRVPASETTFHNGNETVVELVLDLSERADGDLDLRRADAAVTWVNGYQLPPDERARLQADQAKVLAAQPTVVVSRDGELVRVEGIDAFLEATVELLPPEDRARGRAAVAALELREMVALKAGNPWRSMVHVWRGWSVPVGESRIVPANTSGGETEWTHAGAMEDGLMNLRMVRRLAGEAMRRVQLEAGLAAEGDAKKTLTYEVFLDPLGLRPHEAYWANETEMTVDGARRYTVEWSRIELFWDRAEGCGKP